MLPIALACLDSNEELRTNVSLLVFLYLLYLVLAIQRLTDWALKLINIEYIMEKQFTEFKDALFKLRIMKCGIRLCGHLSVLTEDISNDWMVNSLFYSKIEDLDFYLFRKMIINQNYWIYMMMNILHHQ
jgi:hypothetical protein